MLIPLLIAMLSVDAPPETHRLGALGADRVEPTVMTVASTGVTRSQEAPFLYRVLLVRAAPGSLLELIDVYEGRLAAYEEAGEGTAHVMRHSQGDQWDLMLIFPVGSFEDYYSAERASSRREALATVGGDGAEWRAILDPLVAWQEELFAWGPPPVTVDASFDDAGFYHIEMFVALPGKRAELLEQRQMENDFLGRIGRPQNLIFVREGGAPWDVFTLGFYRDIQHFAEPSGMTDEEQEEAAIAAGFEGANRIGTYLRTLMAEHHDTLARPAQ